MRNKLIVIFGASGSGKSTLANEISSYLGNKNCIVISQDDYYLGLDDMKIKSFDEPEALDFELLENNLKDLLNNKIIKNPIYDFITHKRKKETIEINPKNIIILDGTMVCTSKIIKHLSNFIIYCDSISNISFIRRLSRDIKERGRDTNSVILQYLKEVRPAFFKYIYLYKKDSDFNYDENNKDELFNKLKEII